MTRQEHESGNQGQQQQPKAAPARPETQLVAQENGRQPGRRLKLVKVFDLGAEIAPKGKK